MVILNTFWALKGAMCHYGSLLWLKIKSMTLNLEKIFKSSALKLRIFVYITVKLILTAVTEFFVMI